MEQKFAESVVFQCGFYRILDHFTKLYETQYDRDVTRLLRGELPALVDGPFYSLYHGIIQLGYGFAGKCDQVGNGEVLHGLIRAVPQL